MKTRERLWIIGLFGFLLPMCCGGSLWAQQTMNWTSITGGFWDDGLSWDLGEVPDISDTAKFDLDASFEVDFDAGTGDRSVGRLLVENGDVELRSVTGDQYTLTATGVINRAEVEVSGEESSLVLNGIHLESNARVSVSDGGVLVVDGSSSAGSKLSAQSSISIGADSGLFVMDGAQVESDIAIVGSNGGVGVVSLADSSSWVSNDVLVGASGTGNVAVDSSTVDVGDDLTIGIGDGVGDVRVSNAGSIDVLDQLSIGANGGTGSLTIQSGASVSAGRTTVGNGGSVFLDGGDFDFGFASLDDWSRMTIVSGEVSGTVSNDMSTLASTLTNFNPSAVEASELHLRNRSNILGGGTVVATLDNESNGQVEVGSGERLSFDACARRCWLLEKNATAHHYQLQLVR